MIKTITITLFAATILTACSTAKKSADMGTETTTVPKENQARVEKVIPPTNTQAQKTEVLYDR